MVVGVVPVDLQDYAIVGFPLDLLLPNLKRLDIDHLVGAVENGVFFGAPHDAEDGLI